MALEVPCSLDYLLAPVLSPCVFTDGQVDHAPKKKYLDFLWITNAVSVEGCSSTSRSKICNTTQKASKQTNSYGILATLHDNVNEQISAL